MMYYTILKCVKDSCWNIEGRNYIIIRAEESYVKENHGERKLVLEGEIPDPRIKKFPAIEAKYDTEFYHEAAVMECLDFVRKDALENGFGPFTVEVQA